MKVVKIEAAECQLPILHPIKLGPVTIQTRDFVALRLTTNAGVVGDALGYTRATPLLQTVEHIASLFIDADPLERAAITHDFQRAHVNGGPAFVRAVSLFDIALTDAAAKFLNVPLYKLLGGNRTEIPVLAIAGYYLNERSPESVRDEVSRLIGDGFPRTKIMLSGSDAAGDRYLAELCTDAAKGALAVDAHWAWQSVAEALETCRRLDDLGLLFLEDPFGPNRPTHLARLQALLRTPIAAGEDSIDANALDAIGNAALVLRVDATTCGGIEAATHAIHAASAAGCDILPHVHHHLHAQIAGAMPQIRFVEVIPEQTGADPAHLLLAETPTLKNGHVRLTGSPGAGCNLHWPNVERYAVRSVTVQ